MATLNDQQFFHGTKHNIQGDTLKPSSWTGKANYDYDKGAFPKDHEERSNSVFFTNHERGAWTWPAGPDRPRVHVIEPEGPVKDDASGGKGMAYMANGPARIKDTIWIPPKIKPVQGTLPPHDWRKQGGENWTVMAPPTPNDAERISGMVKASRARMGGVEGQQRLFNPEQF